MCCYIYIGVDLIDVLMYLISVVYWEDLDGFIFKDRGNLVICIRMVKGKNVNFY